MNGVNIEVVRLHKLEGNGALKAFADIVIGNSFLIKGMRVIEGKKGLFVGMPREQGKDGKWYDSVFPITKETKEALVETLLEAYSVQ